MSSDLTYKHEREEEERKKHQQIVDSVTEKRQFVVEMWLNKADLDNAIKAATCRLQSVSGVYSVMVI